MNKKRESQSNLNQNFRNSFHQNQKQIQDHSRTKKRILFLSGLFFICWIILIGRTYSLQIFQDNRVQTLAKRQHLTTIPIPAKRATIYDRNGQSLAVDIKVSSIAAHPAQIKNKKEVAQKLGRIFNSKWGPIYRKINTKRNFVWIQRRINPEIAQKIANLDLRGISIIPEYRRFYPRRFMAGQLLGAVGYDAKPLSGIELAFDSYLRSESTQITVKKDASGRLYTPEIDEPQTHNLYLTIDANIQYFTEKYLIENAKKYKVKNGFAVVLDAKNGEILALANYPSFNPNTYWKVPVNYWRNRAISDLFEPGSTFKPVLAAIALDNKAFGLNDKIFCEKGRYTIGDKVVRDHEPYGHLTIEEIIQFSSNIGVAKMAQKIQPKIFYEYLERLGMGKKFALNLPGQEKGLIKPYQKLTEVDYTNMAFGQGLAINGLQLATAYTIFTNQGLRIEPSIIKKIDNASGQNIWKKETNNKTQIIQPQVANKLVEALIKVTGDEGTAPKARVDGYIVAGKTGTAQKVNPKTGTYDKKNYVSSFIGFGPAKNPRFIVYVVYDSPKPIYYGGQVAAPVFQKIARSLFAYLATPQNSRVAQRSQP